MKFNCRFCLVAEYQRLAGRRAVGTTRLAATTNPKADNTTRVPVTSTKALGTVSRKTAVVRSGQGKNVTDARSSSAGTGLSRQLEKVPLALKHT